MQALSRGSSADAGAGTGRSSSVSWPASWGTARRPIEPPAFLFDWNRVSRQADRSCQTPVGRLWRARYVSVHRSKEGVR